MYALSPLIVDEKQPNNFFVLVSFVYPLIIATISNRAIYILKRQSIIAFTQLYIITNLVSVYKVYKEFGRPYEYTTAIKGFASYFRIVKYSGLSSRI